MKTILPTLLFLFCAHGYAQKKMFTVVDTQTNPLPFVHIQTSSGDHIMSNQEGQFSLLVSEYTNDSLTLNTMGFAPFKLLLSQHTSSTLIMHEDPIALNDVIVTQNNLSATEIIKRLKLNLNQKYNTRLSEKSFFMRESFEQNWEKVTFKIDKTSLPEFNQKFWDSLFQTLPKKDQWHTESVGSWLGDWSEENQKLILQRAVNLADTTNKKGYDQIEDKITSILNANVKSDSYFKFKSGIFSTKVQRDEIIEQPKDSIESDSVKKSSEGFHRGRKRRLIKLVNSLHKKEKLDIDLLEKSHHYQFEITSFSYWDDTPVYTLVFKPKSRKAKFQGKLYVDADRFALMEIEYTNTKDLKNFSLLGISFKLYRNSVRLKFHRFENQPRYQIQFVEYETLYRVGIDRPMKIIEKNKFVKGRRKQNELTGSIDFALDQCERFTLVLFGDNALDKSKFENTTENKTFKALNRHAYDPKFWEGYTILSPNEAIRSFKAAEEKP